MLSNSRRWEDNTGYSSLVQSKTAQRPTNLFRDSSALWAGLSVWQAEADAVEVACLGRWIRMIPFKLLNPFSLINAVLFLLFSLTLMTIMIIKYEQYFRVSKGLFPLVPDLLVVTQADRFFTLKSLDESIHRPLKITLTGMLHGISFPYNVNAILILFPALPLAGKRIVL